MKQLFGNLRYWTLDYLYASYWQVRAATSRNSPESVRNGSRAPIVVLPGVYETWRFLQPLITSVHDAGHPVHVLDLERFNTRPVIEAAEQVGAYLEDNDLRDVTILAHSKGGLIGKYVMSTPVGAARINGMLAVATPFNGSWYAGYTVLPSLRLFRPKDRTIRALAEQSEINSKIVSIYGRFDPHIPGGSNLPGAKNVELDGGGHFRVLADPRVRAELAALLGQGVGKAAGTTL